MSNGERCGSGGIVLSFLIGGAIGAGIALLLAPRSGAETRQKIKEYGAEIKDAVGSTLHEGQDYLTDKKAIITAAFEAGKEAYKKETEKHGKGA